MAPIFLQNRLFKEIVGPDWGHFGTVALPLSFDKYLTKDVSLFLKLLLLLFFLLSSLHLFLLSCREFSIGFVALIDVLFCNFSLFKSYFAEWDFLNEWRRAGQRFDVLAGNFHRNYIDNSLAESITQDKLYFDGAWDSENMHLEHFFNLQVQVWPVARRLICL